MGGSDSLLFGFMRLGELMVDRQNSFDPGQHVSLDDVVTDDLQHPTMVQLTLKCSKMDPFQKRVDIVLGATGNELCPVRALFEYLAMRGKANGPLLMHKDGSPMTRSYIVKEIRSTLGELGYTNTLLYSGHGFQAGAATTAAAMQVEDSVIKTYISSFTSFNSEWVVNQLAQRYICLVHWTPPHARVLCSGRE